MCLRGTGETVQNGFSCAGGAFEGAAEHYSCSGQSPAHGAACGLFLIERICGERGNRLGKAGIAGV